MSQPPAGHGPAPRAPAIFCPTSTTLDMARDLPPLVVLRAPRGFGKTSIVTHWLRSPWLSGHSSRWLSLAETVNAATLWQQVREAVGDVAPGPANSGDLAGLQATLQGLRHRFVLVIDNFHLAGRSEQEAADIDDNLVSFVQQLPLFHLIVAGRDARAIEHLGPAAVPSRVLLREHLALDGELTTQLAEQLDVKVPAVGAHWLAQQLLGWPALLRAVLLSDPPSGDGFDTGALPAAVSYARALFVVPTERRLLPAVGAIALAGTLDVAEMAVLLSDDEHRELLPQLRATGLLGPDAHGTYSLPDTAARAVAELLSEDEPALARRLHRDLAELRREQGRAEEALEHALASSDLALAGEIADNTWAELLTQGSAALRRLLRELPEEQIAVKPALLLARDVILSHHTPARAESAVAQGMLDVHGDIAITPLTLTQRLARYFDDGQHATPPPDMLGEQPRSSEPMGHTRPELLLQWGMAMLYDNDPVGAAYGLALASQQARLPGEEHELVAQQAAAATSLALALLGHLNFASRWLAHARSLVSEADPMTGAALAATQGLQRLLRLEDAGDQDKPPAAAALEPVARPLVDLARIFAASRARKFPGQWQPPVDSEQLMTEADTALVRVAAGLSAAQARLLAGRYEEAAEIVARHQGPDTLRLRARYALAIGDFATAARLTGRHEQDGVLRPWRTLELQLVHAVASFRSAQRAAASNSLAVAVAIAEDTGMLLPFLLVPRTDLLAMADDDYLTTFLHRAELLAHPSPLPPPLEAGTLSEAELRVLVALSEGESLVQVARALFLAPSTIKTHLARIYMKLGVNHREAAIRRARALMLL